MLSGVAAFGANAQGLRYGVDGGLNISSPMNMDDTKCGFNIGVRAELPLSGGWFVDGALKLSSKPFGVGESWYFGDDWSSINSTATPGYIDTKATATPYYLQIPLHVGHSWRLTQSTKLNVAAGPYFGIGLWGKGEQKVTAGGDLPSNSEVIPGTYKIDNVFKDEGLRRFEVGVSVQAGVELWDHYRLSLGYDIQCNSMSKDDDYYNQVISVTVGYMF